ncbi:MAG: ribulokinase [Clostridia bacterium]|nr:ribulokinase [Clostridia bacterium]
MKKYVIGIDYGTLSGRCVLVDSENGATVAESVLDYAHAVLDEYLPCGRELPKLYALQHPQDYLDVLRFTVRDVLGKAGVCGDAVIGMGIDFTSCTVLPIDKDGLPLCFAEKYKSEPHAYVKLWKHHAAYAEADEMTALAEARGEPWLAAYGRKVSSEWLFPKLLQILREAPEVYNDTERFLEAADWLSLMLTGNESHSAVFAGYKALWNDECGYPSNDFMVALDERLDGVVGTKISEKVLAMDKIAGVLNKNGAELTGLNAGIPLALPMIDAHAAMPACGCIEDGDLVLIIGTSSCQIVNSVLKKSVDGICGCVKDGVVPGFYTYEAGQPAVGDIFDWFVKNCVPAAYSEEAEKRKISIHSLLRERAVKLQAGESGLLALDWLNGNRSVLVDSELSGMILGLTLRTKPEEIYRALIEATAFGTRMILEQYEQSGIEIKRVCAAGGIAQKDDMMMQIYADVLGKEISIAASAQAGAMGSAVYAAVAAGVYPSVAAASRAFVKAPLKVYRPNQKDGKVYSALYAEYKRLHDQFGKERNSVMKVLRKINSNKIND